MMIVHPRKNSARNWLRSRDHGMVQALLCPRTSWFWHLPPGRAMFHHRIENGQQFTHAGGQGYLFGFASRTQALVERPDHRIEAGRHEGAHIEHGPDLRSSTPDRALPPPRPTVVVSTGPTPGVLRKSSSFSRHTGLSRIVWANSRSGQEKWNRLLF